MKTQGMFSAPFAFLLMAAAMVVVSISAVWYATPIKAFDSQNKNAHTLYRSATCYSPAVQPVIEDLTAVSRRASEQSALSPLALKSQRLGELEGDSKSQSTQQGFSSPIPPSGSKMNSSKHITPLTLMTPSPAPDRQFDTNPDSNLNRPDSAIAAGPNDLVTAVNFAFQVQDLKGANPV